MRWSWLILALVVSLAISVALSLLTHNFIFIGFLPLVFVPFLGRRHNTDRYNPSQWDDVR
jgi:hypothetical protein